MHFFFAPEVSSPFNIPRSQQPMFNSGPQMSLYPKPQDPVNLPYYGALPLRHPALYQEEQSAYICNPEVHQPTEYTAPRDFAPFGALGVSPSYSPSFRYKGQVQYGNFNSAMESHTTSLGSIPEAPTLEPFKEQLLEPYRSSFAECMYSDEEPMLENQGQEKEDTYAAQNGPVSPRIEKKKATIILPEEKQEVEKPKTPNFDDSKCTVTVKSGHGMKGWSDEDEVLLRRLAVQYKFDWKKISKKFSNKKYTPHFLKMRYKGYDEGPVPKRVKFTHEEDILIARYFNDYGIDWEKMVSHFPNRTAIMIKNRYYSHIRKNNRLEALLKETEKLEAGDLEKNHNQPTSECAESDSTMLTSEDKESSTEAVSKSLQKEDQQAATAAAVANKSRDEVALLKAQVKSLKSLYLITYRELNKLKNTQ